MMLFCIAEWDPPAGFQTAGLMVLTLRRGQPAPIRRYKSREAMESRATCNTSSADSAVLSMMIVLYRHRGTRYGTDPGHLALYVGQKARETNTLPIPCN